MRKIIIITLFANLIFSGQVFSDTSNDESSSLNTSEVNIKGKLTGDWGGLRSNLQDSGITIKASLTSFYQGISNNPDNQDYSYTTGTKLSSTLLLNGKKLGLWDGFFMVGKVDYNMGNSINNQGGTLFPVNTSLQYPGIEGWDRVDYSLYFIQFLSKETKLVAGKLNMFDMTNFSSYKGGSGNSSFQNVVFVSTPNGITTPVVMGAFLITDTDKLSYTLALYGANNVLNKNFAFHDAFKDGTTFFGSVDYKTNFFGLPGKQGISGVYSTKNVYNLQDIENSISTAQPFELKGERYSYGYYFEQALAVLDKENKKLFGLFGQLTKSDGKGTPIDWSFIVGVGGNSFIPTRENDRWGLAYSKYSFVKELTDISYAVIGTKLRDEIAVEGYYNYAVNPWLTVGGNVQRVKAGGNLNNDTILGLRLRIIL